MKPVQEHVQHGAGNAFETYNLLNGKNVAYEEVSSK